ncbi:peptide/nickel transport system ATP-binding protein [Sporobacter termitidis DSM 10068]|uniref:Peptide/nickel transport system ATP-binding protein n=1 Tax=Sporobacter termitidis DSM 10068 TaxID=1123282 RepID=A0A1M5Z1X0_9FIRM|nr:ABC transporter ATP-binding protein [Sporobacter termitidis]SHI18247.1 peptide/nickel transport system ATP-binding protein [Sporobacter termitidis DSM 10068]
MLLDVKNLKTEFKLKNGVVRAVDNVSFSVDKGEILAIVGESGSGKSVTSLSIMGLISDPGRIGGGEILFKDRDLVKTPLRELQKIRGDQISMIFQEPMTSLNPVYRVKDQMTESIMTHMKLSKKDALKRTVEMLDLVGIPSPEKRAGDYPHQMSGGMRQRVMIAMALSCHPELLIADEPTTALDVTIQAQILELIYGLRAKLNMAVLLITHDLGVVAEAADRVIVMYCGKIVEEADVKTLFTTPRHPYTVGLMDSIPKLEEERDRLNMIPGMVPNPMHLPEGCAFSDRCGKCMDVCRQKKPALVRKDGTAVRCFLYSDETEAENE